MTKTLQELLGIEFSENLTEEELIKAIENQPKPKTDDSEEVKRLKETISKRNSEVADYKRKLQEHMTAEEKAEEERNEKLAQMETELDTLKKEKSISSQVAEYVAMGFETELAKSTAEALVNGDLSTVNNNLKTHFDSLKKQTIADAMANTPRPVGGVENNTTPMTAEQILSIDDYDERQHAMAENLELFEQ